MGVAGSAKAAIGFRVSASGRRPGRTRPCASAPPCTEWRLLRPCTVPCSVESTVDADKLHIRGNHRTLSFARGLSKAPHVPHGCFSAAVNSTGSTSAVLLRDFGRSGSPALDLGQKSASCSLAQVALDCGRFDRNASGSLMRDLGRSMEPRVSRRWEVLGRKNSLAVDSDGESGEREVGSGASPLLVLYRRCSVHTERPGGVVHDSGRSQPQACKKGSMFVTNVKQR